METNEFISEYLFNGRRGEFDIARKILLANNRKCDALSVGDIANVLRHEYDLYSDDAQAKFAAAIEAATPDPFFSFTVWLDEPYHFTVDDHGKEGFFLEHVGGALEPRIGDTFKELGNFKTPAEAQQAAMDYALTESHRKADEADQEAEEAVYGTYEQQARRDYLYDIGAYHGRPNIY